jgi:hypothetical protein
VPEEVSNEPKNVVHSHIALKCCVWRCTLFVFQACMFVSAVAATSQEDEKYLQNFGS